jgi:hypothetical protein
VRSSARGLAFVLRALRSRNYRLFFAGQLVSMIGNWLTSVATDWLVYRLSGSAILLGPRWIRGNSRRFCWGLSWGARRIVGVFGERWSRPQIWRCSNIVRAGRGCVRVLAGSARHELAIHLLLVLNLCQGLINSVDIPARAGVRQSRWSIAANDLSNAIASTARCVNAARNARPEHRLACHRAAFGGGVGATCIVRVPATSA